MVGLLPVRLRWDWNKVWFLKPTIFWAGNSMVEYLPVELPLVHMRRERKGCKIRNAILLKAELTDHLYSIRKSYVLLIRQGQMAFKQSRFHSSTSIKVKNTWNIIIAHKLFADAAVIYIKIYDTVSSHFYDKDRVGHLSFKLGFRKLRT